MSRSKKVFLGLAVTVALIVVVASILAQIYLAPFVKKQIEEKGSAALGAPVTVESLSISLFPPLSAVASDISFTAPRYGLKGNVKKLTLRAQIGLSFSLEKAVRDLKIEVSEPHITYDLSNPTYDSKATVQQTTPSSKSSDSNGSNPPNITAEIEIDTGRIEIIDGDKLQYLLEDLALKTRLTTQLINSSSPSSISTQFKFSAPELLPNTKVPIALSSDFAFDGTTLLSDRTQVDIAGLRTGISGKQNIKTGNGQWSVKAEARNFPANYQTTDIAIKGAFIGDLDTTVVLTNNSPSVGALNFAADLSRAELRYKNLFHKPAGTSLIIDARGHTQDELFRLESAKLIFDRLETAISAAIPLPSSKQKNSNIKFSFSRTSLAGWEKFFPIVAQAPIKGFIEGAGSFAGNFQEPQTYRVGLKPLKLESVVASIDWQSDDKTKLIRGPIAIDGVVDLAIAGANLESAKADMVADLTQTKIDFKDVFIKASATPLKAEVHAIQKGLDQIEFKNTAVALGTNRLVMTGTIAEPQKPKMNLNISAPQLSLTELSGFLPAMKSYGLSGQAQADIKLSGTYDFAKGIEKSPLSLAGSVTANIPTLKCPDNPADKPQNQTPQHKTSKTAKSEPTESEAILPPWPIARTAVVKTNVSIKQLTCKGVQASGVGYNGIINNGILTGSVNIQNVFNGRIEIKPLKTNLLTALPDTEATVVTDGIDVDQALTWFSPSWKGMVKGRLYGKNSFFLPDSARPDFLAKTRAQGSVQLKNAFISTLQIDQMINQALSKVPGLGDNNAVDSKGIAATMNADYIFDNSVMKLKKFSFLSPEKNEIHATGTVDINQNADISGTAYLATAPIGGSIKAANSDSQGRLVLPFELNGNLMNPSVSFAEKTIQKLAENTAKKELDKFKDRAQEEGKKELEKKLEELKKKGLKGLFGK